jgi:cellulose synthase/poly-beta-1,6-N-acetylglucosamine synthase-like glycosyltransferase
MSEPLISVIVPVYNQWDLIPDLVRSLESQSLPRDRFEVLLVDNGSASVPAPDNEPPFLRRLSCAGAGQVACVHGRGLPAAPRLAARDRRRVERGGT